MTSARNKLACLFKAAKADEPTGDPYLEQLESFGYEGICVPVLRYEFINQDIIASSLRKPGCFSAVILTSQRAVEAIEICVRHTIQEEWSNTLQSLWAAKKCFVVGTATAGAATQMIHGILPVFLDTCSNNVYNHRAIVRILTAQKLGFKPEGEHSGSADHLVPVLLQELQSDSKPVLFPAGNLKRETIPQALKQHNIQLDCITAYETLQNQSIKENLQSLLAKEGVPEYLVFFSPSGVNSTYDIINDLDLVKNTVKLIAIGATTEAALKKLSLPVAGTCEKPTPQSLVLTLNKLMTKSD